MISYTPRDAFKIAAKAHDGQYRVGGHDYISHPYHVSKQFEQHSIEWQAALLHDVLEDTTVTEADLITLGVPTEVIEIVKIVTKAKGETYVDFIQRIIDSGNVYAMRVKIAGIYHNLSDGPSSRQVEKYNKALKQFGL